MCPNGFDGNALWDRARRPVAPLMGRGVSKSNRAGVATVGGLDDVANSIYGNHMSEPTKTTVYLTEADYRRLKQLARRQGVPAAKLVREAVAEYVRKRSRRLRPRSIGIGHSGRSDIGERAEEFLQGMGE